jgi:site-specific recombinase XerD
MRKPGRKSYGYKAKERELIERIVRKRRPRKGGLVVSYRQIAQELNDEGYRTRTGKLWYPRLVRLICKRQKHAEDMDRETGLSHKSDIGPADYLSDEEVRRCRAVLSGEERVIFELMLGSGLRPGEICQLQERDLKIEYGNAAIFVRYGKWTKRAKRTRERKKSHWVYISDQVRNLLARHMRENRPTAKRRDPIFVNRWNKPFTYRNLYDRMQKIGRRAGVKELKPHRMRHTYSTNFLNSGGGIEHLQSQLGHERLETTQIYAKSLETAIRPQVERLQKYHDQI